MVDLYAKRSNAALEQYTEDLARFLGSPSVRSVLSVHLTEFSAGRAAWPLLDPELRTSMDALLDAAATEPQSVSIDLLDLHACAGRSESQAIAPALTSLLQTAAALMPRRVVGEKVKASQIAPSFFVGENARRLKPKKQHEISLLAPQVAQLAAACGTTCVIDVGAGQGHLGRALAARFNLDVVGVELEEHNALRAQMEADRAASRASGRPRQGKTGQMWMRAVAHHRVRTLRQGLRALRRRKRDDGGAPAKKDGEPPHDVYVGEARTTGGGTEEARAPGGKSEAEDDAIATSARSRAAAVVAAAPAYKIVDLSRVKPLRQRQRQQQRARVAKGDGDGGGYGGGVIPEREEEVELRGGSFRSIHLRIDESTDLDVLRELSAATGNTRCIVIGLHACGDLTVDLLKIVARDIREGRERGDGRAIAGLLVVGCCYNKLAPTSFPLSSRLHQFVETPLEHLMRRDTLNLACHPKSPIAAASSSSCPPRVEDVAAETETETAAGAAAVEMGEEADLRVRLGALFSGTNHATVEQVAMLFSRSFLQLIFVDLFPDVVAEPWLFRISTGAKAMKPFSSYFKIAITAHLKRSLPPTDRKEFSAEILDRKYNAAWRECAQLGLLWALRLAIAPLIEALLVVDRVLFMRELAPSVDLDVVFDPTRSPRNFAITSQVLRV